jgi:protein FAM32A
MSGPASSDAYARVAGGRLELGRGAAAKTAAGGLRGRKPDALSSSSASGAARSRREARRAERRRKEAARRLVSEVEGQAEAEAEVDAGAAEASDDRVAELDPTSGSADPQEEGEDFDWDEFLTPAERRQLAREDAKLADVAKTLAESSHKEKVSKYNEKLASLSEIHDIPKVGPG